MLMYRLQNCYYLNSMASCCLKGFSDLVRFHFQGVFSFLTFSVELNIVFGPVVPPIDHLRNRAWPFSGRCPSLSSSPIIRSTTPAVSFTYFLCACMCMLMSVIDSAYIVHKTGVTSVATKQIRIAFLSSISPACINV